MVSPPAPHLEVEVEDAHVVHEADSLADLPDEHHAVHLRQLVVVVDDPLEELTTLHTAWGWTMGSLQGGSLPQAILLQSSLPSWAPWPSSTMEQSQGGM